MTSENKPKARENELVVQELKDEVLIYDLNTNKAYCLNETSALVYQLCNGKNTVAEISNLISKNLNQSVTEDLVWLALDGFKKDNLLETNEQYEINFNNLSRRQVIRRVGLASMVMLPVISSLVAPTPGMAQSAGACIAYQQPCTVGGASVCCPQSLCASVSSVSGTVCTCRCRTPGDCLVQTGCPSTVNCNASGVCAP